MNVERYIEAQSNNLAKGVQSPYFRELVGSLDNAYRAIIDKHDPDTPATFGRLLLICHKSLLSAAALIAQSQPDDSVGITRRAVEAARLALAIKLNDDNFQQWLAFQERHDRWIKRKENKKPKGFRMQFKDVNDPVMEELGKFLGMLSDAYVHFTPEYYLTLDWVDRQEEPPEGDGEIFLNYFHRDAREVEHNFIVVATVHSVILKAFDKCFDGRLGRDGAIASSFKDFRAVGKKFNDEYTRRYNTRPIEQNS